MSERYDVVMLVRNTFVGDTRVEKEAAFLANQGWLVLVIASGGPNLRTRESSRGFDVLRLNVDPLDLGGFLERTADFIPYPEDNNVPLHIRGLYYGRAAIGRAYALSRRGAFHSLAIKKLLAVRPRVIHCHDLNTLASGYLAAQMLGAKVVYDSHELWQHRNQARPRGWIQRAEEETIEKQIIGRVDKVITVSTSIAEHLAETYNIDKPTLLLNVPEETKPKKPRDLRSRVGRDGPILLYLGSIVFGRGLKQAVGGMKLLPEANLVLMGRANADYLRELEQFIDEVGVQDRVFIVPPVPQQEVLDWASGADIGLCTIEPKCLSYSYCLPNKLFQCAFAGIPILATDLPEISRWVNEYALGATCQPHDPKEFARGIKSILTGEVKTMSAAKRGAFRKKWSWQTESQKLASLYQELGLAPS